MVDARLRRGRPLAAVLAVTGLILAVALASPATPASAQGMQDMQGPQPLASEWWFNAWDVQTKVWPLSRGAGVTIAVLDSGVQASLPDLKPAIVPGGDTTGARTNGMTDDDQAGQGHGTAMATLMVGQGVDGDPAGIAPDAKVMPVRVGGLGNSSIAGTTATISAGIRYATEHGAQVINMSFGQVTSSPSGCDPQLQDAVAYALQHNVIVVAAAGDSGAPSAGNPAESPASCAGVLAVAGVNPNLTLWSGSEQQPYVAVAAPGNDVPYLSLTGRLYPDSFGTSGAAAFVSAEAALVRSRYPSMPWYQVEQRIVNTALPEGGAAPSNSFGYGIVRVDRALNVRKYPVPAGDPNPAYNAYQNWLATPQGQQFAHPTAAAKPHPAPVAARASSGSGMGVLIAVIAVIVVVVAGAILFVVARRRRGRTA
jgi:membrane-anchored mycosin MYCP